MRVVLDYSPTLSDAGALLYLASSPRVELLAVTLAGTGEAACDPGVRTTRSLLTIVQLDETPVGCGRESPLAGDRDWPVEWQEEVNSWGDGILPAVASEPVRDAEQLLIDTLTVEGSPVTIVAIGPLTNIGAVLESDPDLAGQIERIVIMGGAVAVPGNVEASPAAEWNIYIDPEAARRVLAAGIPVTMVPLDATNDLPWTERMLRRLADLAAPAARTVHHMAESRPSLDGFYLWDELAAMVAVDPSLVTIESMTVRVGDDGAVVRDPTATIVSVAVATDPTVATDEFLRTLNDGALPALPPLSVTELEYFVDVAGADSNANAALGRAYGILDDDSDPRAATTAFVNAFLDAVDELVVSLESVDPPPPLAAAHADYTAALHEFAGQRAEMLAALATSEGPDVETLLANALADVESQGVINRVARACQVLIDYSFRHDGPRPCSLRNGG